MKEMRDTGRRQKLEGAKKMKKDRNHPRGTEAPLGWGEKNQQGKNNSTFQLWAMEKGEGRHRRVERGELGRVAHLGPARKLSRELGNSPAPSPPIRGGGGERALRGRGDKTGGEVEGLTGLIFLLLKL